MTDSNIPVTPVNVTLAPSKERASFKDRFLALLIDSLILGVINGCIQTLSIQNVPLGLGEQVQGWWGTVWGIVIAVIPILYFTWAYSTSGQTIGKRAMKIKVISMDGAPLSLGKGIIRTLGYIPSSLFTLGFLTSLQDINRQAWHDKLAGTYVVPASLPREQFQNAVDLAEARQTRKRWLIRLGIPTIALIIVGTGIVYYTINRNLDEIRQMGTWPGVGVLPQEAISADLSHLGFKQTQAQNPRDQPDWAEGQYTDGSMLVYGTDTQDFVAIWSFKYNERQIASNDYHSIQEYVSDSQSCARNTYAYDSKSGVIRCFFSNGYQELLWNDKWIIMIMATAGTEYTPEDLADQVQDALAVHWLSIGAE